MDFSTAGISQFIEVDYEALKRGVPEMYEICLRVSSSVKEKSLFTPSRGEIGNSHRWLTQEETE